MSTIVPEDKKVRDAIHWISEHKDEYREIKKLLEEAIFHFNLSPNQEQYLYHVFLNSSEKSEG